MPPYSIRNVYARRVHSTLKTGKITTIYNGIYQYLILNLLSTHAAYLIKIGDPQGHKTLPKNTHGLQYTIL